MNQNTRAWVFLSILSAVFLIFGEVLGGRQGLLIGFILALTLNFYLFFAGDARILKYFNVEHVKGQDPWGLQELVKNVARSISTAAPQVFLSSSPVPFAFSIGRLWGSSKVILSEGLLKKLTPEELKIVVTLQVLQIQKLHNHTSGLLGQFSELLFLGAHGLDRFLEFLNIFTKNNEIHFFQNLISPLGTLLMRTQIKPESFLHTDLASIEFLPAEKNPAQLAEVLWKLHSYATTQPLAMPPSMAPLFVVNPLTGRANARYFDFHPSIEARIKNLLGHYPL